jgi:hypothetical protein
VAGAFRASNPNGVALRRKGGAEMPMMQEGPLEHDGFWLNRHTQVRSPRPACGERSDRAAIRVRGALRESEPDERAPHPNPLPAKSGEREQGSIAAAPQPKHIPLYAPPVHIIKLTETREITPCRWVDPDE